MESNPYYEEFIFKRHPGNPIIKPKDFPGADAVCNCGQVMYGNKTILLVTILHRSLHYRGKPGGTTHVAESTDGIHFKINPDPFLQRPDIEPYKGLDHFPIDPRVTKIEDTYYIIHAGSGPWGTFGILGKTKDFKKHEYIEIVSLPENRVPCLFPEKINGKYYRVDRPYHGVSPDFGNLWIASSPDLIHWGCHRPLLKADGAIWTGWAVEKIGPTPPLKTDAGWLMLTHGAVRSASGARYRIGAMLMDLKDPAKIVGMTKSHVLAPCAPYEVCGRVPNVVFPCGAIADYDKDRIRLYYGAADTYVGLATGVLSELVDACIKWL